MGQLALSIFLSIVIGAIAGFAVDAATGGVGKWVIVGATAGLIVGLLFGAWKR